MLHLKSSLRSLIQNVVVVLVADVVVVGGGSNQPVQRYFMLKHSKQQKKFNKFLRFFGWFALCASCCFVALLFSSLGRGFEIAVEVGNCEKLDDSKQIAVIHICITWSRAILIVKLDVPQIRAFKPKRRMTARIVSGSIHLSQQSIPS